MRMIRILCECPHCGAKDTVLRSWSLESQDTGFYCQACGEECERKALDTARQVELQLFSKHSWTHHVALFEPETEHIPEARLIAQVLNMALLVRFGIRNSFACEGGVEGFVSVFQGGKKKERVVSLVNMDDRCIGLMDENFNGMPCPPATQKVLRCYQHLMKRIFIDELPGHGYAAILRAQGESQRADVLTLLYIAMRSLTSAEFAKKVLVRLSQAGALEKRYLAGLTDEDIRRSFVPPPGFPQE